jgi:hypothetical protein
LAFAVSIVAGASANPTDAIASQPCATSALRFGA